MKLEATKEPPKKSASFAVAVVPSHRTPKLVRIKDGAIDHARSPTSRGSFPGTLWTPVRTAFSGLPGIVSLPPSSNPTTGGATGGPASAR